MVVTVIQSLNYVWLFVTTWTLSPPGSSDHGPGKDTGVGCHFLFHTIYTGVYIIEFIFLSLSLSFFFGSIRSSKMIKCAGWISRFPYDLASDFFQPIKGPVVRLESKKKREGSSVCWLLLVGFDLFFWVTFTPSPDEI